MQLSAMAMGKERRRYDAAVMPACRDPMRGAMLARL